MPTRNQVKRILFNNLIDLREGRAFALLTVSGESYSDKENRFRHASLIGKLKKLGYEVYDFEATPIEASYVIPRVYRYAFVIEREGCHNLSHDTETLIDKFKVGLYLTVPNSQRVICHESLTTPHSIALCEKHDREYKYLFTEWQHTDGIEGITKQERAIFAFVLKSDIRSWPEEYNRIRDLDGYDAREHWLRAYEQANEIHAHRTACEEIMLDTEFHDAALIAVMGLSRESMSDCRKREISLRAFLRLNAGRWSRKIINRSTYTGYMEGTQEVTLWYVCDEEDSGVLLPALYEQACKLEIRKFFWISAGETIVDISVGDPLGDGVTSAETLENLKKGLSSAQDLDIGPREQFKKFPKKLGDFHIGNQFAYDKRPPASGNAERLHRHLTDSACAKDWRKIDLAKNGG